MLREAPPLKGITPENINALIQARLKDLRSGEVSYIQNLLAARGNSYEGRLTVLDEIENLVQDPQSDSEEL